MQESIKDITEYLYNCNFLDDNFDPENEEYHLDKANELCCTHQWNEIIEEWHKYLYEKCRTPEAVINFANLFYYYGGADRYNPEPYKFLGYLYKNVDMDVYWDNAGDLFDSIALNVLQNQGLIDIKNDPYYNPLEDKHILKEIDKWNKKT